MPESAEKLPMPPAAESDSALADMARGVRFEISSEASCQWEAASQEELEEQLNGYEQIELINRGGMGLVYRVFHRELKRHVAIKVLDVSLLKNESAEDYLGRFFREGQSLARLNHPGIVRIHEFGTLENGSPFFIMEHVDGADLAQHLKESGRFSAKELLPLAIQITEALQIAHESGIIHRDIKPANLLLSKEGQIKIADFGLARLTDADVSRLTRTSTAPGTPYFIAPELLKGEQPSLQSDLYALGVTFYQLLTGELPRLDYVPPSSHVPDLDQRWDELIKQLLKTSPAQRPTNALQLKSSLEDLTKPEEPKPKIKHWLRIALLILATAVTVAAFFAWQLQPRPGDVMDLLPLFDPSQNTLFGQWQQTPQGLQVKAGDGGPFIITAPVDAGTDFDFEVEFSTSNPDISTFNQFFHIGNTLVEWTLNAHPIWALPYHGFPRLDGKDLTSTPETYSREPIQFVTGQRYRSRIQVRQGQISAWLDDRQLVHWQGEITRFQRTAHFPIPRGHFALLSWTGGATYHRVTLTHRSPEKLTPPAPKRPSAVPSLAASASQPYENTLGMKFVRLPGTQTLIAIHETRRRDYAAYATANPRVNSNWQNAERNGFPVGHGWDHPVVCVNWYEAKAFCDWLSQKEELHYRLPTDREWSIAAGISDLEPAALLTPEELGLMNPNIYTWGSQWPPPPRVGNLNDTAHYHAFHIDPKPEYTDGYATTSPVMSFKPNQLGMYDLSGNVWEWCEDWFNEQHEQRVLRGCHFGDIKLKYYPASCRTSRIPTARLLCDGFRCVIDLSAAEATPSPAPEAKAALPLPAHLTAPHENSLGMKFVHLPGTRIQMGIHEVRRQDYATYAETSSSTIDSKWRQPIGHGLPAGHLPDHPVVCVSWHDATAFCQWLSQKEKRRYRLPTDREWSLAVGLGSQETSAEPPAKLSGRWLRLFPWGESWPPTPQVGNYSNLAFSKPDFTLSQISIEPLDGFISTAPVMSFPPNALGIYDLGGNVWEWLQEPLHPPREDRILRGAGWDNHTQTDLRSSYRHRDPPHYRLPTNGFRCVLELEAPSD